MAEGEDDVEVFEHKGAPKPTERALEEQLHRPIGQRRAELSALIQECTRFDAI